jgi:hypothetical protein
MMMTMMMMIAIIVFFLIHFCYEALILLGLGVSPVSLTLTHVITLNYEASVRVLGFCVRAS